MTLFVHLILCLCAGFNWFTVLFSGLLRHNRNVYNNLVKKTKKKTRLSSKKLDDSLVQIVLKSYQLAVGELNGKRFYQ